MGEHTKKKRAADARAACKAKNAAQSVEDPASADPPHLTTISPSDPAPKTPK
jgi:hypothetical protein